MTYEYEPSGTLYFRIIKLMTTPNGLRFVQKCHTPKRLRPLQPFKTLAIRAPNGSLTCRKTRKFKALLFFPPGGGDKRRASSPSFMMGETRC